METVVWHNRQPTCTMKNGPGAGTSALDHGADFALSILTTSGRASDSRLWYIGSVCSHPETKAGIEASPDRSSAYGAQEGAPRPNAGNLRVVATSPRSTLPRSGYRRSDLVR